MKGGDQAIDHVLEYTIVSSDKGNLKQLYHLISISPISFCHNDFVVVDRRNDFFLGISLK